MFHTNNGLYFERKDDGSVIVSHWFRGSANAGRADQTFVDVLDREWTLTPEAWASVVAAMSARGETGDTFREATIFHTGEDVR